MTTTTHTDTYAPIAPLIHHGPQKIAPDTYLIRSLYGEGQAPVSVYVNSMVILGTEPVIVDTGTAGNRANWLDDAFSLVDPKDVRWVFISHDDSDHTGNLVEVMSMCPDATLVTSWFQVERLAAEMTLPLHRMRWVDDGQSFLAGDRELVALRPPLYDSPTTRGLYDPKSRVYWASDCFATPVFAHVEAYADVPADFRPQGIHMFHSALSPWVHLADQAKFNQQIDRIAGLDIEYAASAHTPMLRRDDLAEVIAILRTLPQSEPARLPGQADLEAMIAAMSGTAAS